MVVSNSGRIYRLSLDHGMGYAYAQLIDFTDVAPFDGLLVYVYERIEQEKKEGVRVDEIVACDVIFGPAALFKEPNTRGKYAWKYIGQTDQLIVEDWPVFKSYKGDEMQDKIWSNLHKWYKVHSTGLSTRQEPCEYEEVRHLETRILQSNMSVAKKITMMQLISRGEDVSSFYDLSEEGTANSFVQLVNTYYSDEDARKLVCFMKES